MAVPLDHFVTPAGSSHAGRPSLLARYRTLPEVRTAIETLESQGVDGDDLALAGHEGHLPGSTERRTTDSRFLHRTMLVLTIGVVVGAIAGAVLGAALIGLVLLVWTGLDATGWIFLLITAWFAAGGAVLGCFTAVSKAVGFSESWPSTFEDSPDEPVWLAIFDDAVSVDEIEEQTRPLQIVPDPPSLAASS
jgi:hypothetical protein